MTPLTRPDAVPRAVLFLACASLLLAPACASGGGAATPSDNPTIEGLPPEADPEDVREAARFGSNASLILQHYNGLRSLGPNFVYEGWLVDADGNATSTGTFFIRHNGKAFPPVQRVSREAAGEAESFVVTIEPRNDPDPDPSGIAILAGDFNGRRASLSVGHAKAIGTDFADAFGTFFLAAPTAMDETLDQYGIWFIDNSGLVPAPGLTLPTLNAGWIWEGWIVVDGVPQTTGRFLDPAMADSDGGGPAQGPFPEAAPPFPGSDFIDPPTFLPGGRAVITLEPEPDTDPAPFFLRPLSASSIMPTPRETQDMTNNSEQNPTGRVFLLGRL